jgi:hypothetical protein
VGLPPTAEGFVDELQRQLTEVAARVDLQFPQNTAIRVNEKGEPVLPKYNARTIPESAQRLHAEVMRRMPQRGVLDILVNVEHLTNFNFSPSHRVRGGTTNAPFPALISRANLRPRLGGTNVDFAFRRAPIRMPVHGELEPD